MKSLITEIHPWEMSSSERRKFRTCPEKSYREGRPMALSFTYLNVEPQVEEIVEFLHQMGIATSQSADFADGHVALGAVPITNVSFECGKISPQTLVKIKQYLEKITDSSDVKDGNISFKYRFPSDKKANNIEAQLPENANMAKVIWHGVIDILKQDLPQ